MATDTRKIIQKAQIGLDELQAGDGVLAPAHAREFLRVAITEANLMPMCTVVPMRAPQQRINTLGLSSRVLRAGTPGQQVQNGVGQTGVDFTAPEFDAKLFRGEVPIEDEVLEDNIEQGRFRQTVLDLIPRAIGRDIDEIAINGDLTSADPFLAQFDGFLAQATDHPVDFSGRRIVTVANDDPFADMTAMLHAIPRNHRSERDRMKFLTSYTAADNYLDALINRPTPLGDAAVQADKNASFKGNSVVRIGMWPEDLGVGENATKVLLCNPKNLQFGIWRQVKIQLDPWPREGKIYFVISLRLDVKIAIPDSVVTGINVLNS